MYRLSFKETVARDFCYKLRLWGFESGHTGVTHPLLTSVHCSVSDPDSLNPDPDPAKNLNPDPDPGKFVTPTKNFMNFL